MLSMAFLYASYNSAPPVRERRPDTPTRETSPKSFQEKAKASPDKAKSFQDTAKSQDKVQDKVKSQKKAESSQKKEKPEKHRAKEESKTTRKSEVDLRNIPLLQRPVPPSDADRPFVMEILAADKASRSGKHRDALEKFNEVLKQLPQSPRALFGKAQVLESMALEKKSNKLMDSAIEFYQDVGLESFLANEDLKYNALVRLAACTEGRAKHQPLLLQALEELHHMDGENPLYARQLGVQYIAASNMEKANVIFKDLLRENTEDYFAVGHVGFLLFSEGRYEDSLPLLLDAIHKDKEIQLNPKFYLYAGEVLTRLGRKDEVKCLYVG